MSITTAFVELNKDLAMQSEFRRNVVVSSLVNATKDYLNVFPNEDDERRRVDLYPDEVLAALHFLVQFGFHLKPLSIKRYTDGRIGYLVIPNWK